MPGPALHESFDLALDPERPEGNHADTIGRHGSSSATPIVGSVEAIVDRPGSSRRAEASIEADDIEGL